MLRIHYRLTYIKPRRRKSKTIFVVTTMRIPDENTKKFFDNRSRSVGWFPTLKLAEKCVVNNYGDICEFTNNFCVIEEVESGIYNCNQKEYWYKWNKEKEKYQPCQKPECYRCVINFGLG
jgi:hypothetical protein